MTRLGAEPEHFSTPRLASRRGSEPRHESFRGLGPAGFHRLHYTEWGRKGAADVLICAHGYSGTGRDFDALARALSGDRRVACPDVAGRGGSDWLSGPHDYQFAQFLDDLNALIARLDVEQVDWVGTSMGGLLGMMLAARPNSPIRRLVMNDVGAFLPMHALKQIARGLEAPASFATLDDVEMHLRRARSEWGALDDAQWRDFARHNSRPLEGGGFRLHYDPAIALGMSNMSFVPGLFFWDAWQRVSCPVLLIRGADSNVFPRMVGESMLLRHPNARLEEIPGCGHAPALAARAETELVRGFLEAPLHWADEDSHPVAARAAR